MQYDMVLDNLLSRWQLEANLGRDLSAAELCADRPELVAELERRIAALRQLDGLAQSDAASTVPPVPPTNRSLDLEATISGPTSAAASNAAAWPSVPGYEIVGELGRGGMGVVYRARDESLERSLAIKVLLPEHADQPDYLQRFLEEARIMAQLQHPGVAPLHEIGTLADGRPFFAMKQVKGRTLAAILKQRQDAAADLPVLLAIFTQVCQTLAYAHERRIIHRDLKPDNVMVGAFGEVQVMDWGLAKVLSNTPAQEETPPPSTPQVTTIHTPHSDAPASERTRAGSVMGTLAYMPPEQALGQVHRVDQRSDVFGLGAILCEILTGQPPYAATETVKRHLQACRADQRDALEKLQTCGADPELIAVCQRCLAPDREDRPAHGGELAETLAQYHARVQERLRAAEIERVRAAEERKWRRMRWALGLAAVAAVLLIAVAGTVASFWLDAEDSRQIAVEASGQEQKARQQAEDARVKAETAHQRELAARKSQEQTNQELAKTNMALELAQKKLFRFLYLDRIALAWQCYEMNDIARCRDILASCDFKDTWEWRHLDLTTRPQATLAGHKDLVQHVAFSPDGQTLASASYDGTVKLWDTSSGKERATLVGHLSAVLHLAFSPDGQTLASAGHGKTLKLWDTKTGKVRATLAGHKSGVWYVAFSPDGKTLASASSDNTVKLWDMASGKERSTLEGHKKDVYRVAFSPDGQTLASIGDNTVKLWDMASGKERATLAGHKNFMGHVTFSPDGQTLASGGDGGIKLWDTATGRQRATLPGFTADHVAFSPDGQTVAAASVDTTVALWRPSRGSFQRLEGHKAEVLHVAFSPDGQTLASSGRDAMVKLWNVAGGKEQSTLKGHNKEVHYVAFSPDGQTLASASDDKTVKLWDVAGGKDRTILAGNPWGSQQVAFTPDSQILAWWCGSRHQTQASSSRNTTVKLWDVISGKERGTLQGHKQTVYHVAFSPNGQTLASASSDNTVKLWDTGSSKEQATLAGHMKAVLHVAFSPDGQTLASASSDNTVKLWDMTNGKVRVTLEGHKKIVYQVSFSPDGQTLASASDDKTVKLWDVASGKERTTLAGHMNGVLHVAFSPDGQTLASASVDNTVKLWDVASGKEQETLRGHMHQVVHVGFSPDGQTLASAGLDYTVKLWDMASGKERATLAAQKSEPLQVAFSPDSQTLASASHNNTVKLWDVTTGKPLAKLAGHKRDVVYVAFSPDGHTLASADIDGKVILWYSNVNASVWDNRKLQYVEKQAAQAEAAHDWFAAVFDLRLLLKSNPNEPTLQSRLNHAEAELKKEQDAKRK